VHYFSARIETLPDAKESLRAVYNQMAKNLMENMIQHCDNILRINVLFPNEMDLNALIGRAAHIRMLDSPQFAEMFVSLYDSLLAIV
jgi:hypothetical protein